MTALHPATRLLSISLLLAAMMLSASACGAEDARGTTFESAVRSGDPVETYAEELDDPAARFDIADVTRPPLDAQFHFPSNEGAAHPTHCRWYRFTLDPALEHSGPWVLAADLESVALFEPAKIGYRAEWFGETTPVAARRLQNGLSNVDIPHADYGRVLYVRVDGPQSPVLTFRTLAYTLESERLQDISGIFFASIFGILTIAAILFAFITKVRTFAYYGIYMATQTLNQLNGLPFAARALWPKVGATPWMFDLVTYMTLLPLSFMFFVRDALGTRRSPVLDRMVVAAGIVDSLVGIAYLSLERYGRTSLQANTVLLVYMASFIVMGAVAFVRWRQRYVSAGIYLVGLIGVVAGFAAVPVAGGAIDTADFGFVWEAIAFLTAIAYRLVQMTKEREGALAEVVVSKEAVAQEYALRVAAAERFNEVVGRFVPREFLEQLGHEDVREVELGDHVEREMTVLFCDIRAFVALSEQMTPQATFDFLNLYFGRVGPVIRENHGFIDKYVGDGVMALFPGPADDAIRAAIALHAEVRRFNEARARDGGQPIEVGVGLNRGRLMLATIGERERYDTTVIADVVNVAARLEGLTNVYGARIIVSEAVVSSALDPEAYNLRWLGDMRVRGSALPTSAYEVCDGDATQLSLHKRATSGTFATALTAYRNGDFSASFGMFAELVRSEPQDEVARFFMERSNRRVQDAAGWDGVEHHDLKR